MYNAVQMHQTSWINIWVIIITIYDTIFQPYAFVIKLKELTKAACSIYNAWTVFIIS